MTPLSIVLGRVSFQLTDIADRLSRIAPIGDNGRLEIVATQTIDFAEQMNRALSSVVAAIARSEAASESVETNDILVDVQLDDLKLALAGVAVPRPPDCDLELF